MAKRIIITLFVILFLYISYAFLSPFPSRNLAEGFKPDYGFSYSFERAGWFGLDSRKAYIDLLDSAHFKWVRLPFFWDSMVRRDSGNWVFTNDFEDLRFAVEQAKKRDIKVIVALGAKTPYYPEFHLPSEEARKLKFGQVIDSANPIVPDLVNVDKMVVSELSSYDNIAYWQVENEPFLANVNNWKIDKSVLLMEMSAVRKADPYGRPIILNHVGPAALDGRWKGLVALLGGNDVIGVNAYFKTQGTYLFSFDLFGRTFKAPWPRSFSWPVQSWLFLSPNFFNLAHDENLNKHDLWVLEMQAEPYIRVLADADKEEAFSASDIGRANKYLVDSRVKSVGLWGAEFWEYRKSKGDLSWLDSVKAVVR